MEKDPNWNSQFCQYCGHIFIRYPNFFGTVCPGCHAFLNPEYEPSFIKHHKEQLKNLQEIARQIIRKNVRRNNVAIVPENTQVVLGFTYEADDYINETYYIRFHYMNDEPFVSVSLDNKEWYDFPWKLWSDISSFIAQYLNSNKPVRKQFPAVSQPVVNRSPVNIQQESLPAPQIQRHASNVDPIENFDNLEALVGNAHTRQLKKEQEEPTLKQISAKKIGGRRQKQENIEKIDRPVIRSKTQEDSNMQRMGLSSKPGIKRAY